MYSFLKIYARLAILLFCRRVIINRPELLKEKAPLLLACNHPNSFLDAIIIDILFKKPVWSLARGDAFTNTSIRRLLYRLKMLPVYRVSEGVENLNGNYETFEKCRDLFKEEALVLIFSEGLCKNKWELRPLKKGTARLSLSSWNRDIPLRILPVGINYSSFRRFGKNVFLHFGNIFSAEVVKDAATEGLKLQAFNQRLRSELEPLVYCIADDDLALQNRMLEIKISPLKKWLLALPAGAGWLLHAPLYGLMKWITASTTKHTGHYDSVLVSLLFISYPFYLLLCSWLGFLFFKSGWAIVLVFILPLLAWAWVQLSPQLDKAGIEKD